MFFKRALWGKKLIEVIIAADEDAPPDYLGNYVVSFWRENEDEPRDQMRLRVLEILERAVLPVLQSSCMISLPSVVLVNVSTDGSTISLCNSIGNQRNTGTYAQSLALASKMTAPANLSHVPALCALDSISFISAFESGSAGAYLVQTKDDLSPVVLKVLTETDFLLHTDDEMFSFRARLAAMYREIHVLMKIPPHPHIVGPPVALVTVLYEGSPVVCGFLSLFHPGGTIARALSPLSPESEPPSLARRTRWANQMVSAIHHLHRVAHTYHGDIKLDNVVLSTHDDAVFIDFEQGRHAEGCLAPEAQGSWDVSPNIPTAENSIDAPASTTIHYVRYVGPGRDDTWSAYEAWAKYPEVIEALEVYSLGDALRTLFEGVVPPRKIGSIIGQCLLEDPAARPRLDLILAEFMRAWETVCLTLTRSNCADVNLYSTQPKIR
jgi:hypothetical protein